MDDLSFSTQNSFLHHGILGQKWGVQNGPPYPLDSGAKSPEERRAKKSVTRAKKALKESKKALKAAKKVYKEIKKSSKVTKDEAIEYLKQKGMLKDGFYFPSGYSSFQNDNVPDDFYKQFMSFGPEPFKTTIDYHGTGKDVTVKPFYQNRSERLKMVKR